MRISSKIFSMNNLKYWVGYGGFSLGLVGLLVYCGLYVPGALSSEEIATVIKTASISFTDFSSLAITNLPFHLLQKISFSLFGVTTLSIKLPAIVLALLSAVGLLLLMSRWFKPNVAILSSIIAITTGQFLFIAQSGTPDVLYIFYGVYSLLLGTLIARRVSPGIVWKITLFALVACSLYTPLSIYVVIALLLAVFLHPHLRFVLRGLSKVRILISATIAVVIASPLLFGIIKTPSLGFELIGIPNSMPDISSNLSTLYDQYLGFTGSSNGALLTPVFGLGSIILILIGVYYFVRAKETTQSYIVLTWMLFLVPVLLLAPSYTSAAFVPLVLLLGAGISTLLGYWYGLFPRNPYARIAGLLPLSILVGSLVLSGIDHYTNTYLYNPRVLSNFSFDIKLLPKDMQEIVASPDESALYAVIAKYSDGKISLVTMPTADTVVYTRAANVTPPAGYELIEIRASSMSHEADRLYIYKKA